MHLSRLTTALLLLFFVMAGGGAAMGLLEPEVEHEMVDASFVGRIRIQERDPIRLPGDTAICGYVYKATVVEGFRGQNAGTMFFGGVTKDYHGMENDYLALVNSLGGRPALDVYFDVPKEIACLGRSGQTNFVQSWLQNLWAIEKDRKQKEWLNVNRLSVVWCYDNGGQVKHEFEFKDVFIDGIREQYPNFGPWRVPTYEAAKKILLRGLPMPVSPEVTLKTGITEVSATNGYC